jgi:hypothetical protein
MLYLIARLRLRPWTAGALAGAYLLSWPFDIYSTAIRGYPASSLIGLTALYAALRFSRQPQLQYALLYLISAVLAVAILPTNLMLYAGLAPVLLLSRRSSLSLRLVVAACPLLSLLFYAPLADQFLSLLDVRRGWEDRSAALLHTAAPLLFLMPALPLVALQILRQAQARTSAQAKPHNLIAVSLLIPLLAILLLPMAPFPRVFVPLLPIHFFAIMVWAEPALIRVAGRQRLPYAGLLFLGWALLLHPQANRLAQAFTPDHAQDDLIQPYYLNQFHPDRVADTILKPLQRQPGLRVYLDRSIDHLAIVFAGRRRGIPDSVWLYDKPSAPIARSEPIPFPQTLVTHSDAHLERIRKRFQLESEYEMTADLGHYQIYQAR